MSLTKYASLESAEVLELKSSPERAKQASLTTLSDFHDYRTEDGYLYARIRAISSRVNKNHDGWPTVELAGGNDAWEKISSQHHAAEGGFTVEASKDDKYGFSTFIGKPHFVDHHNSNPERARGVVVDAKFNVLDQKTAAADDEYWGSSDADKEHMPPSEVELLIEIDAKTFPKLAKAIVNGDIDGFSMGCDVDYSKCSHCGHEASTPDEYCSHIQAKGAEFDFTSSDGKTSSRKSYENCYGIKFFEISAVFDPADETALIKEIHNEGVDKKSSTKESIAGPEYSPSEWEFHIVTRTFLREADERGEELDPEEARDMAIEELTSRFAIPKGVTPGEGVRADELLKVKDYDPRPNFPWPNTTRIGPVSEPVEGPGLNKEFQNAAAEELNERWPTRKNLVRNDPRWSSINKEGSYLSSRKTAQPDEPQSEAVRMPEEVDTLREEKICPLCGSNMENGKCDVCGYDEPPESLQNPDLDKAKEQVEELDEQTQGASPEQAPEQESYLEARNPHPASTLTSEMRWTPRINLSKIAAPKPQGDEPIETVISDQDTPVTSAFRTAKDMIEAAKRNQEGNTMSKENTKVAADPADPSGKAKQRVDVEGVGGVYEDSAEATSKADTQTDPTGKGGVYEDSNAATSKPHAQESLPSSENDNAGFQPGGQVGPDTQTFKNTNEPESAVTDKAFPTAANHGTQPADPIGKAQDRIDVEQPPHDRVAPDTQTWTGTDGNGVLKQQPPVTKEPVKANMVSLAALKLAEAEVELGIISQDDKFNRLAELEGTSEEEIVAEHRALAKVKTAGLTRTASNGGAGRLPSFKRIASEETPEPQTVNDSLLDSALYN